MTHKENVSMTAEEIEKANEIERVANLALRAALTIHDELGKEGEELVEKNQFGETALRVDIEAERAVLNILKQHDIPIKVISEEHGTTIIGENPIYLGILDGLDGSHLYREQRGKGRYGTMFGIYANTDPTYNEYIYGGVMEHAQKRLFFATKGRGSHVIEDGNKEYIHVSEATILDRNTRLYADTYFDQVYEIDVVTSLVQRLGTPASLRSSAIHYADLARGVVDGVVECTRKGNLEIAIAFPLITEAGGVMVDRDGTPLNNQKYSLFGQSDNIIVISAGTPAMASAIAQRLQ